MKRIVFLLGVLMLISFVLAVPQYTNKYVNDFAGIFSSTQVSELKTLLQGVETDTTAEVVVVSSGNCSGSPTTYAQQIFDSWKIGKAENDNGLLILYCQQENKIWVQTGYGLEGILPDSKLGRMLDDFYVPARDAGNVTGGIVLFTQEVSAEIEKYKEEVIAGKAGGNQGGNSWIIVVGIIFILTIGLIVFSIKARNLTKKSKSGKVKEEDKATRTGIKKDTGFNTLNLGICAVIFFALYFTLGSIFALIGAFVAYFIIAAIRGVRCEKDGLRMKKIGKEGNYTKYKCANGHVAEVLTSSGTGFFIGGGFGGGGGGGFGGGGFGGGASGGGGAGR